MRRVEVRRRSQEVRDAKGCWFGLQPLASRASHPFVSRLISHLENDHSRYTPQYRSNKVAYFFQTQSTDRKKQKLSQQWWAWCPRSNTSSREQETGMEGLNHRTISTNGITTHFVEMGSGPVVLFLHGFPEGWYCWRKQISKFAKAGYRAIAPDLRGYGDTSAPEGVENYSNLHIVGDLIGLLDALEVQKVFLVTHDWGAVIGWQMCLFRPDRIIALASLSVPFMPRNPSGKPVQLLRKFFGDEHYIVKFQAQGEVEAQIASMSSEVFFRYIFGTRLRQTMDFLKEPKEKVPLPEWMTEEDLAFYVTEFEKNGFTPAFNYYRAADLSWELTAPWTGSKVMVPAIFITGDEDIVYDFPGHKQYIHEGMATDVPLLKEVIILEGVRHFIQLEKPEAVNDHVLDFFKGFHHGEA